MKTNVSRFHLRPTTCTTGMFLNIFVMLLVMFPDMSECLMLLRISTQTVQVSDFVFKEKWCWWDDGRFRTLILAALNSQWMVCSFWALQFLFLWYNQQKHVCQASLELCLIWVQNLELMLNVYPSLVQLMKIHFGFSHLVNSVYSCFVKLKKKNWDFSFQANRIVEPELPSLLK